LRRSRLAQEQVAGVRDPVDAIIQYGSSFDPGRRYPYYVYSDDFTRNAIAEQRSWGGRLSSAEARDVTRLEDRLFVDAAGVFAFSERIRRRFASVPGLDPAFVHVAYPGANFAERPPSISTLSRSGRPTVLFVGKEWDRKGGPCVLEAFKRVRAVIPTARLIVVGPTGAVSGEGVEHVGYLSKDNADHAAQLRRLYEEAWVFCLPTTYEPFGIAFVEAMWFGLPCIGTDDWAIPEIIDEGTTGFRLPVNDPTALADRIIRLLSSGADRGRMSLAARLRAETLFSWDATAHRMLSVIQANAPVGRGVSTVLRARP
jgi:glycosyltransferase involved in cell wall biosynthesis